MKKLLYLLCFIPFVFTWLVFPQANQTLDINIHDTFYVTSYFQLTLLSGCIVVIILLLFDVLKRFGIRWRFALILGLCLIGAIAFQLYGNYLVEKGWIIYSTSQNELGLNKAQEYTGLAFTWRGYSILLYIIAVGLTLIYVPIWFIKTLIAIYNK